jgi:hypothetical protein
MRKRPISLSSNIAQCKPSVDLDSAAIVEVTSEDKNFQIESALSQLSPEHMRGWRAAGSGTQKVRLLFDRPQELKRISLVFEEHEAARTQEFVLRWSPDIAGPFHELVRQQWNFSPPTTTREVEEYDVALPDVAVLELIITPDISGGSACASLKSMCLCGTAASTFDRVT